VRLGATDIDDRVVLVTSHTCSDRQMALIGKPHLTTIVDIVRVDTIPSSCCCNNDLDVMVMLSSITRVDSELFD
jgi:hypothetical protein